MTSRPPMLLPLLALVAGIMLGGLSFGYGLAACVCALLCLAVRRFLLAVCCIFIALGVGTRLLHEPRVPQLGSDYKLSGAVVKSAMSRNGHLWLELEVDSVNHQAVPPFGSKVFTSAVTAAALPGEYVALDAHFQSDKPNVGRNLRVLGPASGFHAACRRLASTLRMRLLSADISAETFAMVNAMLLGNTDNLPPAMRRDFAAAGVAHILALSGTHVAAIGLLAALICWPLYVARRARSRLLFIALLLWGYACLTGLMPSVVRAVAMFSVYALGRMMQWRTQPINTLLVAAFAILIVSPLSLSSVSFQLSFAAVAGILIFNPLYNPISRRRHPWLYRLCSYLAVSLAAMTFTGVISAYYFNAYPPYFLLANILVLPLVPPLIFAGVLSICLPHSVVVCAVTDAIARLIMALANYVASLPGGDCQFALSPTATIVVLLLLLSVGLYGQSKLRKCQREEVYD